MAARHRPGRRRRWPGVRLDNASQRCSLLGNDRFWLQLPGDAHPKELRHAEGAATDQLGWQCGATSPPRTAHSRLPTNGHGERRSRCVRVRIHSSCSRLEELETIHAVEADRDQRLSTGSLWQETRLLVPACPTHLARTNSQS